MGADPTPLPPGCREDKSKPFINLLRGWPSTSLLPVELLKQAANAVLSDTTIATTALLYGPDEGYQPFREEVAKWLTAFYNPSNPITAGRICINGGASQSLAVLLGVYTDPEYTRNIWLVSPSYMLAFRIFEDAGFAGKLRAVAEDEEGIDIAYLRCEIEKSEAKAKSEGNTAPHYKPRRDRAKVYKHVVYCVPTFSNPSSRTMSLDRRQALVRLAREYDVLVICDDVYDFLQFPAGIEQDRVSGAEGFMNVAHLPRLVDVDRSLDGGAERRVADGFGNVCSNGTFSKLLGPGLRCGWIEGTEKFSYGIGQAGCQRSGGSPCQLTSTYITRLLASGQVQSHISTVLQPAYASRYSTMVTAIEQHLRPLGFVLPQPNRDIMGGYFIWLGLPDGVKATELAKRCQEEEKLIIAPGNIFEVPGDYRVKFENDVRLCFSYEDVDKLSEGVRRIGAVAERMLDSQHAHDGDGEEYVVVNRLDHGDGLRNFI